MPTFGLLSPEPYSVGFCFNRIVDMVLGTTREQVAQLVNGIESTDTSLLLAFAGVVAPGAILSIDDELIYVWAAAANSNGLVCTVQRGYRNTTPMAHNALELALINPYFSGHEIHECMRDEIRSWPPQVFQVKTLDLAAVNFVQGYDLGNINPWIMPLKLQISPSTAFPNPQSESWPTLDFTVDQSAPISNFPSGNSLTVTAPGGIYQAPQTLHFTYAAPFNVDTSFVDATDLVGQVGIDESDLDIVIYGAAWRLTAGMEIRRNLFNAMQTSGELQQTPPGSILHEADYYKTIRNERLGDAQRRLRSQFPLMRR